MAGIDFIYFDLGKVILEFDHDLMGRQIASLCGVEADVVERLLNEGGIQNQYETGLLNSQQFFDKFCQQTNSTPEKSKLLTAMSDIFDLNAELMPLITQLRAVNFPIGVLSNTCEAHWEFVGRRFPSIHDGFSKRILSYEVKCMKPHSEIYAAATQLAGCPPENIFFVDDKQENVDGALKMGLVAVRFENAARLVNTLEELGVRFNL